MTTQDLFKRLTEANFSFTKPCNAEEIIFLNEQKKSMDKLIICGLVEKVSTNKYSLSADGRKAKILGVKKWAENLTDIERRVLIYDFFEFKYSWYNRPKPKEAIQSILNSTISKWSFKAFGILFTVIVLPIVSLIIWDLYRIELVKYWNFIFS
jgi:hypothetical protein